MPFVVISAAALEAIEKDVGKGSPAAISEGSPAAVPVGKNQWMIHLQFKTVTLLERVSFPGETFNEIILRICSKQH